MPINTVRLNQKHLHPNERITFIKPIPDRPTTQKAELYLQKIAAICYPIMKAHHLSITTLEEFPPNREFMGRNFNGGEVIQLVLRRMPERGTTAAQRYGESASTGASGNGVRSTPSGISVRGNQGRLDPHSSDFIAEYEDGGWLDFRAVSMVMMHELAHCIEMNHSKAFWKVRNDYAEHLKVLWARGYTGEGVWGRGQDLSSGIFERGGFTGAGDFGDLCGGAYRGRRGRRRGQKEKVSYAERKKRKLEKTEKKFGKGEAIGESESMKVMLEGKFVGSKPRVANSKRGRDLRANAALARFEKAKNEVNQEPVADEDDEDATESEGSEDDGDLDRLVDASGKPVKDGKGNTLYRICDDGSTGKTENAQNELEELNALSIATPYARTTTRATSPERQQPGVDAMDKLSHSKRSSASIMWGDDGSTREEDDNDDLDAPPPRRTHANDTSTTAVKSVVWPAPPKAVPQPVPIDLSDDDSTRPDSSSLPAASPSTHPQTGVISDLTSPLRQCAVCSLSNPTSSGTCQACGHVLDCQKIPDSWTCGTESCLQIGYINAGDVGVCGICGARKGGSGG